MRVESLLLSALPFASQSMKITHLYDSSDRVSSSAIASSNACLARWHARSGLLRIS